MPYPANILQGICLTRYAPTSHKKAAVFDAAALLLLYHIIMIVLFCFPYFSDDFIVQRLRVQPHKRKSRFAG